jgi:hypothetical protein
MRVALVVLVLAGAGCVPCARGERTVCTGIYGAPPGVTVPPPVCVTECIPEPAR